MSNNLTEDQRLMRESCRAFVDDVIDEGATALAHHALVFGETGHGFPCWCGYAALRVLRNSPMRSSALRMFSVELA